MYSCKEKVYFQNLETLTKESHTYHSSDTKLIQSKIYVRKSTSTFQVESIDKTENSISMGNKYLKK